MLDVQLETAYGRAIYTMEICKYYISELSIFSPLKT